MICKEKKFIWIAVPRVASTTINLQLIKLGASLLGYKHETYRASLMRSGSPTGHDYFSFAFVRNPWERVISMSRQSGPIRARTPCSAIEKERIRITNFVKNLDEYAKSDPGDVFTISQTDYLRNLHGEIDMDYIGRFENLQEDFDHVCGLIGYEIQQLEHHNKSNEYLYRELYTDEARDIIYQRYEDDIRNFGYEF